MGEIGEPSRNLSAAGHLERAAVPPGAASDGTGAGGSGGTVPDPFAAAPTCTSGTMWTQGDHGSDDMNPGRACITCHTTWGTALR